MAKDEKQKTETVGGEVPVIWSQKRVPNIEKGYNKNIPFYMMGIFAVLIVLSLFFAVLTS